MPTRLSNIVRLVVTIVACFGTASCGRVDEPDVPQSFGQAPTPTPIQPPPPPAPTRYVYCSQAEATVVLTFRVWHPATPARTSTLTVPLRPRRAGEQTYAYDGIPPLAVSLGSQFTLELSGIGGDPHTGFEVSCTSSCPLPDHRIQAYVGDFLVPPEGYRIQSDGCLGLAASYARPSGA